MIAKELDPFESTHEYEQAGRRALEQTADYLKLAYGNAKSSRRSNKEIIVLNGLRLEGERHGISVDHLILYPQGFILVENRSRRADLEVNALGEWTQMYKGAILRIPSPMQQAERKLRFLQQYFRKFGEQLPSMDDLSYDYVITLPDEGSFRVPAGLQFSQVCRAHKLPEHLELLMRYQGQGGRGLFRAKTSTDTMLVREDLLKVSVFLRQNHQLYEPKRSAVARPKPLAPKLQAEPVREPVRPAREPQPSMSPLGAPVRRSAPAQAEATQTAPKPAPSPKPTPSPLGSLYDMCQNCGEHYLQIDHHGGQFQYQCLNCETYTPIDRTCTKCAGHRYVRRSGNEFFLECEHCLTSRLIYVNPTN